MSSSEATIRYAIAKFTVIRRKRFVRGREQGQKDFYTAAFLYVREYARRETHQTRAAALFARATLSERSTVKSSCACHTSCFCPFPSPSPPFSTFFSSSSSPRYCVPLALCDTTVVVQPSLVTDVCPFALLPLPLSPYALRSSYGSKRGPIKV